MKVKAVLRFWYEGRLVDKGEVLEVDEALAHEVITSGKAVVAETPAQEPAAPNPQE